VILQGSVVTQTVLDWLPIHTSSTC